MIREGCENVSAEEYKYPTPGEETRFSKKCKNNYKEMKSLRNENKSQKKETLKTGLSKLKIKVDGRDQSKIGYEEELEQSGRNKSNSWSNFVEK